MVIKVIRKIISFLFSGSLLIFVIGIFYLSWAFAYSFTYGNKILPFDTNLVKTVISKSFIISFISFIILKFIKDKKL